MSTKIDRYIPTAEEMRAERKRVRDRNYRFKKLPPERQRVTIAKDVIAGLEAKRFFAAQQGYFHVGTPNYQTPRGSEKAIKRFTKLVDGLNDWRSSEKVRGVRLNEVVKDVPCTVCGIGACFIAAVDRLDGVTLGYRGDATDSENMREYLGQWFEQSQIALIEVAFERTIGFGRNNSWERCGRAKDFGFRYNDPTERLIAIMQNIIDNDGEFCP